MGETGSCSDGQGLAQQIFNPIFFDGRVCVLSLLFDLRPNYGGWGWSNEDNGNLLQALRHSVSLTLEQATTDPCLLWRFLDTQGKVWASLLWGHLSFPLGAHKVLFVPSKSLFPQSCASSSSSRVGSIATSSKRAYSIPLWQAAADMFLHTQTLRGRSGLVSVGFPGVHKVTFEPSLCLWRV